METNKKINYKFATAPVALFYHLSGNEFKLITYLINLSNLTNNNIVSVSYSYLSQACNINSHHTLKKIIDNLIKLNLITKVSGNITTNNSYTINYTRILELENTNEAINEVPEQAPEQPAQEQAPQQPMEEQPMKEPAQEEQPQPEQPQPIIEEKINNNNMEEKEIINNEELFEKVEEFILTKNNDIFFDWHETIEHIGAYFSREERIFIKNNFDTFKKRQNLFRLYDRIKMELIAPTYTEKKEVKKEEYLPF